MWDWITGASSLIALLACGCGAPHGFLRAAPTIVEDESELHARSVIDVPAGPVHISTLLDTITVSGDRPHWIIEPGVFLPIGGGFELYVFSRRDYFGAYSSWLGAGIQWTF